MGPGGPVGLNMSAVNQAMDDYHIDEDERIDFSYMVRKIANIIFVAQHEKAEHERALAAKKRR